MSITFYQGEADPEVSFTITDSDGSALDVSTATLGLEVKKSTFSGSILFTKEDSDFDTIQASSGIVKVPFTSSDTDQNPGSFVIELTITFSSSDIRKQHVVMVINREVD